MGVFSRVVLCLVLLVPLIGTASAATYTATPISIGTGGQIPGTGPNVRFEVKTPTGTRYGNAMVPVSTASLGKMAVRAATTNIPLHLAIMAFVAAKENWNWDPLQHRFVEPGETPDLGGIPQCTGLPPATCAEPKTCIHAGTNTVSISVGMQWVYNPNVGWDQGVCDPAPQGFFLHRQCFTSGHCIATGPASDIPPQPDRVVPHEEVGETITDTSNGTTPNTGVATQTQALTLIRQLLTTTINNPTTINNDWPELTTVRTTIISGYTNYDVTEGDDFVDSSTEFHGVASEWPLFCEWASVVCDFIDWFREDSPPPEHPELPTEEPDVWEEWDSGMPSTGSCPAPHTTEFMGNAISIPFDDFCHGLSTYFRPIFIALALFAAGFILVGARQ